MCQSKIMRHIHTIPKQIPVPQHLLSHVHIDLVSPLPTPREGYCYLSTTADSSMPWADAISLKSIA